MVERNDLMCTVRAVLLKKERMKVSDGRHKYKNLYHKIYSVLMQPQQGLRFVAEAAAGRFDPCGVAEIQACRMLQTLDLSEVFLIRTIRDEIFILTNLFYPPAITAKTGIALLF